MNQIYFIKVLNGKGKTKNLYRIQTIWNNSNNSFTITILDGNNAFQTSVINKTLLNKQAKNYEIDYDEYINTIRLSLSLSNLEDFAYNLKENKFLISRTEKKFNRQFADFNLEPIDFNVASINIIDELMKCNDDYQNQILVAKEQKDVATNEKNVYLDKLQHFVHEKQKIENELYSKFILLLNEKKLRIQYLTDVITKNNIKTNNDSELQIKINNLRNKEMLSESESNSEDETSEKIVHEVQIEAAPKQTDFLDCDTQEIPLETLPKRSRIIRSETKKDENNVTKNDDHLDDITNVTQDVLEFNTQDLFDRL